MVTATPSSGWSSSRIARPLSFELQMILPLELALPSVTCGDSARLQHAVRLVATWRESSRNPAASRVTPRADAEMLTLAESMRWFRLCAPAPRAIAIQTGMRQRRLIAVEQHPARYGAARPRP